MQRDLIIFCAFTRDWVIDSWLDNLAQLEHNPSHTSLVFIIDIDSEYIKRAIEQYVDCKGYKKVLIKMNPDHAPNEVRIAYRRQRIADVKNQSKWLIAECEGEYVLSLEDDTVFGNMNIKRLMVPFARGGVGFVEGVQCGRWGSKMIGAWNIDDPYRPNQIETLLPGKGFEEITGGGWYGYITLKELYLECAYYTSTDQPWGPDVNYGIWLNTIGYTNYIDWQTVFGHHNRNEILYPDENMTKIIYTKSNTNGKWLREDIDERG